MTRTPHRMVLALLALLVLACATQGDQAEDLASITSASTQPPEVSTHWNALDWPLAGDGSAEIVSPGRLVLATATNTVTKVSQILPWSLPQTYTIRFRYRVDSYGTEQGVVVYDGARRVMLYFRADGIAARNSNNLVELIHPWTADRNLHDYTVVTTPDGSADLFVDGRFARSWVTHAHVSSARVEMWVKGPTVARVEIDMTELHSLGWRSNQPWSALSWPAEGPGSVTVAGGHLRLQGTNSGVTRTFDAPTVPSEYVATWRQKVDQFGTENGLAVYSGTHRAMLYFRGGGIEVQQEYGPPHLLYRWAPGEATGWHEYRMEVLRVPDSPPRSRGQLYVDGRFAGDWNLQAHSDGPRIEHWVLGNTSEMRVDYFKLGDLPEATHGFWDSFEDEPINAAPSHWLDTSVNDTTALGHWRVRAAPGGGRALYGGEDNVTRLALLHGFSRNTVVSGDFLVESVAPSGGRVYLESRRNGAQSHVVAIYNFDQAQWCILEQRAERNDTATLPVRTIACSADGTSLTLNQWHHFEFETVAQTVTLTIDGSLTLSGAGLTHNTFGRVGLGSKSARIYMDDVSYVGDGPIDDGFLEGIRQTTEQTNTEAPGITLRRNQPDLLMQTERSCRSSTNGGRDWANAGYQVRCGHNMIELAPGSFGLTGDRLLRVVRPSEHSPNDGGPFFLVEISNKAEADTWYQQSWIQASPAATLVPGKLMQTTSGRLFLPVPSGELEGTGGFHIAYTSNLVGAWTFAQTVHSQTMFGRDMEAGAVVQVDAEDEHLKVFMRTADGYLYESESFANGSYDAGEYWTTPQATVFRSARADFGVARDPSTGHHYMVWQYDDPETHRSVPLGNVLTNRPRTRLALAVSRDGTRTWEFLAVVDDWQGSEWRHMNTMLAVRDGIVHITTARSPNVGVDFPATPQPMYWRIDTSRLAPSWHFPMPH